MHNSIKMCKRGKGKREVNRLQKENLDLDSLSCERISQEVTLLYRAASKTNMSQLIQENTLTGLD